MHVNEITQVTSSFEELHFDPVGVNSVQTLMMLNIIIHL
jgi:hypothetical protein